MQIGFGTKRQTINRISNSRAYCLDFSSGSGGAFEDKSALIILYRKTVISSSLNISCAITSGRSGGRVLEIQIACHLETY